MRWFWHRLALISGFAVTAVSLSAGCGGRAASGGTAGETGSGGTSAGVAGATHGGTAGTPSEGCWYDGQVFGAGSSFPSTDGCNTCSCARGGAVACTARACDVCPTLANSYTAAVEVAKRCNPALSVQQCTLTIPVGLACGCPSFVNPSNGAALTQLKDIASTYAQNGCGSDILCGACLEPTGAYCSGAGRCEDTYQQGRGCKVGGVLYPDGATGIPDPVSCNQCSCSNGNLGCTEIGCPRPCPSGSAFGQQCAQCGPTDACLVVESGCFPTCVDTCAQPGTACISGLCLSGFCG